MTRARRFSINPSASRARADSSGFTLLEMLISISLTALLMAGVVTGLRVANRAWERGEARLRQEHVEGERDRFLDSQISSLVPYVVASTDPKLPGKITILQATPYCLRFVTAYSSRFRNRAGLVLAEYAIVGANPGPLGLLLRETPVLDDSLLPGRLIARLAKSEETGNPILVYQPFVASSSDLELMTGLDAARFDYLDLYPKDGSEPRWVARWDSKPQAPYPAAIRLRWERRGQREERVIPIQAPDFIQAG